MPYYNNISTQKTQPQNTVNELYNTTLIPSNIILETVKPYENQQTTVKPMLITDNDKYYSIDTTINEPEKCYDNNSNTIFKPVSPYQEPTAYEYINSSKQYKKVTKSLYDECNDFSKPAEYKNNTHYIGNIGYAKLK